MFAIHAGWHGWWLGSEVTLQHVLKEQAAKNQCVEDLAFWFEERVDLFDDWVVKVDQVVAPHLFSYSKDVDACRQ